MNGAARARPESGVELYAWLFMRVSGLALLFLALGHLLIMHVIHNVETIDYQFVAHRFMTPFWRTYDLVMLWLALLHGLFSGTDSGNIWVLGMYWASAASLVVLTMYRIAARKPAAVRH